MSSTVIGWTNYQARKGQNGSRTWKEIMDHLTNLDIPTKKQPPLTDWTTMNHAISTQPPKSPSRNQQALTPTSPNPPHLIYPLKTSTNPLLPHNPYTDYYSYPALHRISDQTHLKLRSYGQIPRGCTFPLSYITRPTTRLSTHNPSNPETQ